MERLNGRATSCVTRLTVDMECLPEGPYVHFLFALLSLSLLICLTRYALYALYALSTLVALYALLLV